MDQATSILTRNQSKIGGFEFMLFGAIRKNWGYYKIYMYYVTGLLDLGQASLKFSLIKLVLERAIYSLKPIKIRFEHSLYSTLKIG